MLEIPTNDETLVYKIGHRCYNLSKRVTHCMMGSESYTRTPLYNGTTFSSSCMENVTLFMRKRPLPVVSKKPKREHVCWLRMMVVGM